jgi:hypothetical protein
MGGSGASSASGGEAAGSGGEAGLPAGTYLVDDDGYVIFEIESLAGDSPPGDWALVEDAEQSGGAYYQYQSTTLDGCANHGSADESIKMVANFEVKEKAFYQLVWRNMRANASGGCETDRNNDSFMKLPGALNGAHFQEPFKVFGGGFDEFNWSARYDIHDVGKELVCIELDAGVQTLEITPRSNNHAIDRVAIFRGDATGCTGSNKDLDDRENTGQAE